MIFLVVRVMIVPVDQQVQSCALYLSELVCVWIVVVDVVKCVTNPATLRSATM